MSYHHLLLETLYMMSGTALHYPANNFMIFLSKYVRPLERALIEMPTSR